jgi:hypothetical protein
MAAGGPLIAERWADDPNFNFEPPTEPGVPMGLTMEPGDQPPLEARPGPGSEVPKLLTLIGAAWVLWLVWSQSGRIAGVLATRITIPGRQWGRERVDRKGPQESPSAPTH